MNSNSEEDMVSFRYEHFSDLGKKKLASLIKQNSRIWTIRKESGPSVEEIMSIFEITNPIIVYNYYRGFSYGQFPAWRELELSRLVYYSIKRRRSPDIIQKIIRIIATRTSGWGWINRDAMDEYMRRIGLDYYAYNNKK